jgi:Uma2 family endonuclease
MRPVVDEKLPPLTNGDSLTGVEFERREKAATDEGCKAELIDGVVYMTPPVGLEHGEPHALVIAWLVNYALATPGVAAADNVTLRLDERNRPQPDACLWIIPKAGGRVRYDPDKVLRGTVELAVEVAVSSAALDLHKKKDAYSRQGLPEYVVLVVHSKELLWFVHEDGDYVPNPADGKGIVRSRIFPGLWLDTQALLRADGRTLMETLRAGLASPEHEKFAALLAARLGQP